MRVLKTFSMSVALLGIAVCAYAADMPMKAAQQTPFDALFKGYPYGSSGPYIGLGSEGGAGKVNGSVPGIGSIGLTETQASVAGIVGWAWGRKNSPVAFQCEGRFGWTNVNGATDGFSLSGPAQFEQGCAAYTPLAGILGSLPNNPFGTQPVAPFPPAPQGVTTSNVQLGLYGGIQESDIHNNFPGLGEGKEWRVRPVIGLVAMEQWSNGLAVRAAVITAFPDKTFCFGPVQNACAAQGQYVGARLDFLF